jgi:hypothetical protein
MDYPVNSRDIALQHYALSQAKHDIASLDSVIVRSSHAAASVLLLKCSENKVAKRPSRVKTMTTSESTTFVIVGLTTQGRKFRPSDWAERLCGVMSAFGAERRMKYSPYVGPGDYNGEKAVFVDGRLGEIEPMAYRFMLNFAQDNDLQIIDGVCSLEGRK